MPGDARQADLDLKRTMLEEGYLFDFFQLVHLLETWLGRPVPIGRGGPYRAEGLRLRPDPSLVFSPADVRRVQEPSAEDRGEDPQRAVPWDYRVTVNFMGLYGVASPSPVYLTELIGFTDVDANELTQFLDLFNHRILSLFYRAWLKYRYPWRYEPGGADEVSGYLLSFIGLGDPEARARTRLPAARLLRYLGLLALRTRPPVGLKLMVADHFGGVPTRVEERIFRWVTIPPEGRNRLGEANSTLGVDLSVGEKVPDRAGKFRLSIGPLGFTEYLSFLPDQGKFSETCSLSKLWVGDRFDYDVELVVKREEIPEMRLDEGSMARLGWTSWVTSAPGLAANPNIIFAGARLGGESAA
jgi:type VI secretion system protein ImpH